MKNSTSLVTFVGSDQVLSVYTTVECESQSESEVFVAGKLFSDIVRELPEALIKLETTGSKLKISSEDKGHFEMKIPLVEEINWEDVPSFSDRPKITLPSRELEKLISKVQFCIQHDSPRNYGTVGYLHESRDNQLRLVGSDGFRLSMCEVHTEESFSKLNSDGVSLSKRALLELQKMCSEAAGSLEVLADEDGASLLVKSGDSYQIHMRLSSIKFPNYETVIPKEGVFYANFERAHLSQVIKRVLLASDKSNVVELTLDQDRLKVRSRSTGEAEGEEFLNLDAYEGKAMKLTVNGRFLLEILSANQDNNMKLGVKSAESPPHHRTYRKRK